MVIKEKLMFNRLGFARLSHLVVPLALLGMAAVPARAQWAVVDQSAIVQLVQQVATMKQQLQTAQNQLTQAQQALKTMTGDRGMAALVSGTPRNYLPSSAAQLAALLQGGGYSGLAADIRAAIGANAVLTPPQLAALPATDQQHILAVRQSNALQQALAQAALANASGRFASLQTLIAAIPTAADQKAILDLQARMSAELGMLQNEQTKLQSLQRVTAAMTAVLQQQEREQIVAGHGRFATRFQPMP
jgi:type IV secretion system protein VirB5